MTRVVTIEPVTRIEGHARIHIHLDAAGAVDDARVEITSLRGFEQFVIGRPAEELPRMAKREVAERILDRVERLLGEKR